MYCRLFGSNICLRICSGRKSNSLFETTHVKLGAGLHRRTIVGWEHMFQETIQTCAPDRSVFQQPKASDRTSKQAIILFFVMVTFGCSTCAVYAYSSGTIAICCVPLHLKHRHWQAKHVFSQDPDLQSPWHGHTDAVVFPICDSPISGVQSLFRQTQPYLRQEPKLRNNQPRDVWQRYSFTTNIHVELINPIHRCLICHCSVGKLFCFIFFLRILHLDRFHFFQSSKWTIKSSFTNHTIWF